MSSERERFRDFVRETIRDKKLSYRDVSTGSGGRISATTVSDIINRQVGDVKTETLLGLAEGLGVTPEAVFAAYRGVTLGISGQFESELKAALTGYEELSDQNKRELLPTVRMLGNEIQRRRVEQWRENKKKIADAEFAKRKHVPIVPKGGASERVTMSEEKFDALRDAVNEEEKTKPDGKRGRKSGTNKR
jgi:hypothetical protein